MSSITVIYGGNTLVIPYEPEDNSTLSDILYNNGIIINTVCGGAGFCGKCTVDVDGTAQKACSYRPSGDITVNIPNSSLSNIQPAGTGISNKESGISYSRTDAGSYASALSIAIDIGSTSVSIALINMAGGSTEIIDIATIFNPTINYGTDIISRAQASVNGKKGLLSSILTDTLESEAKKLITANHLDTGSVKNIYISCNTTMQHLLLGLDCTGILTYPFTPAQFEHSLIYKGIRVFIIPSFSTFVGGDIVSGLYYLSADRHNRYILLDLGTNAEMVLVDGNRMFCTSAAAGPAFEGASISCGCAYIKGAVKNVSIRRKPNKNSFSISYKTIDNKLPCGVCGSGIMDIYAQLITNNIIDEHKTFTEQYIDSGFEIAKSTNGPIVITQNDIRQVQLAVSAIKTGIDILLLRSGLIPSDIERVYISGSFGKSLNPETLKNIRLMPQEFINPDILEFSGNTSLYGAIKAAFNHCTHDITAHITGTCTEIELANDSEFNRLFISNM